MSGKIQVVVNAPRVQKSFDAKATKSAADLFAKALGKALDGGDIEVVRRVKDKGFEVNPTIQDITYEEKKRQVNAKVQIELAELPGPKMFSAARGGAGVTGVDLRRPDPSLKDLFDSLAEDLGAKAAKAIGSRVDA